MRLLMLADASSLHTRRWADWFAGRGHQVLLASLEDPKGISVPFVRLPGRSRWLDYLRAVPALRQTIQDFRPDLVNAHFVPNYGLMGKASGFRPLAVSAWGSDLLISAKKSLVHRLRARWALAGAGLATCDGQSLADELAALGVVQGRILNVPMGVDRRLIASVSRELHRTGPLNIVSTRSLEPVYGVGTIIRALPAVVENSNRPVNLTVIGDGSLRKNLERLARELGVESRITFAGRLEHWRLMEELDKAAVYVSASLSDSTSVSLLEAMARGLVPVAGDIPGNREWIENEVNGLLFPPGDHAALSRRLLELAGGTVDTRAMIERNLELVRNKGCWQDNMAQVEKAFLGLAK